MKSNSRRSIPKQATLTTGASRPARRVKFAPVPRTKLARLVRELGAVFPPLSDRKLLSSSTMESTLAEALKQETAASFKDLYLEANVLKRFQGSDPAEKLDRRDAAIQKLLDSEVRCKQSNDLLCDFWNRSWPHSHEGFYRIMRKARYFVCQILGTEFPWEEFPTACNFGPGATTEFNRKVAHLHNKWASSAQITTAALPYLHAFEAWGGLDLVPSYTNNVEIRNYNEVFTVPKNFDRDRSACKPVTWNGFFQKGIGTLIRRRLQRFGLLTREAQEQHRVLARIGSQLGALATLDLSGASDGISLGLVQALLPASWLKHILALREEYGRLPSGDLILWEKVSTMGNGFTFELETLLFYAIACACYGEGALVSLYGDDIIVPAKGVDILIETFALCGFEFNREKTFTSGFFRESCGGHYFNGVDVKPFYIKELPACYSDVVVLHNDIVRWCLGYPTPSHRFHGLWRICRDIVPRDAWGPPGKPGVLWAEWDDCRPTYKPDEQAFVVTGFSWKASADLDESHYGRYLQNLWEKSDDIDSIEHSTYRKVGDLEHTVELRVDRAQWKRLTAETLCT